MYATLNAHLSWLHTTHLPYSSPRTILYPTTVSSGCHNPLCTHTSDQNLPAHNIKDHVQILETNSCLFLLFENMSLTKGLTMNASIDSPSGCARKNFSIAGSKNVFFGCMFAIPRISMSRRCMIRICNVAESVNMITARRTFRNSV